MEPGSILIGEYTTLPENRLTVQDITVVIPVYNTPPAFLHCCINSVFRQTVLPARIMLIDDGSTDPETRRYLDGLEGLPKTDIVRNKRNLSLGPTMNSALDICKTRYVLKLDSDDIARSELVEKLSNYARRVGGVDVLGCQWQSFGFCSAATRHPERVTRSYVINSPGYWIVNHTGVLLNRESVLAVNGYRCMRGMAEDYELWIRMMLGGFRRFFNVQEILLDRRDLPTGLNRNFRRGWNRFMLMYMKSVMRTCADF